MRHILILVLIFIFYSLNVDSQDKISDYSTTKNYDSRNSLSLKDSSINVSCTKQSKYTGINLTDSLARKVLYDYFIKKGFLIIDNLPEKLSKKDHNKICVQYDTLYFVDLNNNKYTDAIIEYWLAPFASRGHCYQPHKAMIVDQDSGYKLINVDFIPSDFIIESVLSENTRIVICGISFDCSSNQTLKRYNLILKK